MKETSKNWWMVLLKGIILIALSFFIFGHPGAALVGLALYIGITLMITGFLLLITGILNHKNDDHAGWKLAEGIVDIIFGSVLLSNPAITATVFPFVVGFWMIFYGVTLFAASFGARKAGNGNWWINLLGGLLTIIVGYIIMNNLFAGAFAITFWIGSGILFFGLANISIALRMRKAASPE